MTELLTGWIIGMQLVSAHYGAGAGQLEWATPGVYAMHPSGATASVYRNSEGHASVLAGWTWQWLDGRVALTAGAVTGYSMGSVLPIVMPSVRLPLGDTLSMRLSFVPPVKDRVTGAVTLSAEFQL